MNCSRVSQLRNECGCSRPKCGRSTKKKSKTASKSRPAESSIYPFRSLRATLSNALLRRLSTKPATQASRKLDAVARRRRCEPPTPVTALKSLLHRCAARSTNRSQERPPQLHSRGNCSRTPHAADAARARAPQLIELARAPCGCKAAQLRSPKPQHFRDAASEAATLKDAQGPVQKATKARPAPSFGKTRSGL